MVTVRRLKGINYRMKISVFSGAIPSSTFIEHLIEGVSIDMVENGIQAIAKHTENDYDLILMDADMPEMDGMEASTLIRKMDGDKKNIPIIALTASVLKEDIQLCLDAGMNDAVPKPFNRAELVNVLGKYFSKVLGDS